MTPVTPTNPESQQALERMPEPTRMATVLTTLDSVVWNHGLEQWIREHATASLPLLQYYAHKHFPKLAGILDKLEALSDGNPVAVWLADTQNAETRLLSATAAGDLSKAAELSNGFLTPERIENRIKSAFKNSDVTVKEAPGGYKFFHVVAGVTVETEQDLSDTYDEAVTAGERKRPSESTVEEKTLEKIRRAVTMDLSRESAGLLRSEVQIKLGAIESLYKGYAERLRGDLEKLIKHEYRNSENVLRYVAANWKREKNPAVAAHGKPEGTEPPKPLATRISEEIAGAEGDIEDIESDAPTWFVQIDGNQAALDAAHGAAEKAGLSEFFFGEEYDSWTHYEFPAQEAAEKFAKLVRELRVATEVSVYPSDPL